MASPIGSSTPSLLVSDFSATLKTDPMAKILALTSLYCFVSASKDFYKQGLTNKITNKFGLSLIAFYTLWKIVKLTSTLRQVSYNLSKCTKENTREMIGCNHLEENSKSDKILKTLIQSYKPKVTDEREIVFVVLPFNDPPQAFSLKRTEVFLNFSKLAKTFQVKWIRASSVNEITHAMSHVTTVISHLWILAHGSPQLIQLGTDLNGIERSCLTKQNLSKSTFPNLRRDAHILLSSCYAGTPTSVGLKIAELHPEAMILAPLDAATIGTLYIQQGLPYILQTTLEGENVTASLSR